MGDHAPVVEDDDVVGQAVGLLEVLRGQDDRRAVAHQTPQEVPQIATAPRVEAGGRFVEEQDGRIGHEAGGEVEAPPHAAGEVLDELAGSIGEVEPLEELVAAPAGLGPGQAVQATDHLEVQATAHEPVDGGLLGGDADPAADVGRLRGDVEAGDRRRPLRRLRQRGQDPDGGRLARPVVTEQAEDAPRRHVEVEAPERPEVVEALPQAPNVHARRLLRMVYWCFVHSTSNVSSTMYEWQGPIRRSPPVGDRLAEKLSAKAAKVAAKADKLTETATRHAESLERLAERLDSLDLWTATSLGAARPASPEPRSPPPPSASPTPKALEAVTMRRLAAELDAGTMTLYHYLRTKDELLALLTDTMLGEVVVPDDEAIPDDWRAAHDPAREAIPGRPCCGHPWALDIADDQSIRPQQRPSLRPDAPGGHVARHQPARPARHRRRRRRVRLRLLHRAPGRRGVPDRDRMVDYVEELVSTAATPSCRR